MYWVPAAPGVADLGIAVMIFVGRVPETLGFGDAITIVCLPVPPAANCGREPGLATPITPGGRLLIIVVPLGRPMPDWNIYYRITRISMQTNQTTVK